MDNLAVGPVVAASNPVVGLVEAVLDRQLDRKGLVHCEVVENLQELRVLEGMVVVVLKSVR